MAKTKKLPAALSGLEPTEIASMAADAAVRLSLDGRKTDPQTLWRMVRSDSDPTRVPVYFAAVLDGPTFKQVLDIRLRRNTLSSVEDVTFLRDLCRDILKLTGDGLLEDMLLHPHNVKPADKRGILKDVSGVYERLLGRNPPAAPDGSVLELTATAEEAVVEQAREMEDNLSRLPVALRERRVRQWKLDALKEVNERETELLGCGPGIEKTGA